MRPCEARCSCSYSRACCSARSCFAIKFASRSKRSANSRLLLSTASFIRCSRLRASVASSFFRNSTYGLRPLDKRASLSSSRRCWAALTLLRCLAARPASSAFTKLVFVFSSCTALKRSSSLASFACFVVLCSSLDFTVAVAIFFLATTFSALAVASRCCSSRFASCA